MADSDVQVKFGGEAGGAVGAITEVREVLQGLISPIRGIRQNLGELAEAFIAAFAVEKIVEFASRMAEAGEKAETMGHILGTSAGDASKFTVEMGAVGISADSASAMVGHLSRSLIEAQETGGGAAAALRALGISAADLKNGDGGLKSTDELLKTLADRFKDFADGPEKTAVAMALLGRQGAQLIPFLDKGRDGIAELGEIATRTGGALTTDLAAGLARVNTEMYEQKLAQTGLANTLSSAFLPAWEGIVKIANDVVEGFNRALGGTTLLGAGLKGVAGTVNILVAAIADLIFGLSAAWNFLEAMARQLGDLINGLLLMAARAATFDRQGVEDAYKSMISNMAADDEQGRAKILAGWKALQDQLKTILGHEGGHEGDGGNKPPPKLESGSQIDKWKAELQKLLAADEDYFGREKQMELAFWEDKSKLAGLSAQEQRAVAGEIFGIKKSIAQEEMQVYMTEAETKKKLALDDYNITLAVERDKLEHIKQAYGERSARYAQALAEMTQMEMDHQKQIDKMALEEGETRVRILQSQQAAQEAWLSAEVEAYQITAGQKLEVERKLEGDLYTMQRSNLQTQLQFASLTVEERKRVNNEIEALEAAHNSKLRTMDAQRFQEAVRSWQQLFQPINNAVADMVRGVAQGTQRFSDLWKRARGNLVLEFAVARIQIEVGWLATQAAMALGSIAWANKSLLGWIASLLGIKVAEEGADATKVAAATTTEGAITGIHESALITRAASDELAAGASILAAKTAAAGEIPAWAAIAGAAGVASAAAIPYIGWLIAPEAGDADFAAAMAFAPSASLAVGAYDVPNDMVANIHKGEMVVPQTFSEGIRNMMGQGGKGGGTGVNIDQLHIHAVDAESFTKLVRKHPGAIAGALGDARRSFMVGNHLQAKK